MRLIIIEYLIKIFSVTINCVICHVCRNVIHFHFVLHFGNHWSAFGIEIRHPWEIPLQNVKHANEKQEADEPEYVLVTSSLTLNGIKKTVAMRSICVDLTYIAQCTTDLLPLGFQIHFCVDGQGLHLVTGIDCTVQVNFWLSKQIISLIFEVGFLSIRRKVFSIIMQLLLLPHSFSNLVKILFESLYFLSDEVAVA